MSAEFTIRLEPIGVARAGLRRVSARRPRSLTGFALAGIAHFWHHVLGYVAGLERKHNDEAEALEKSQGLRRVA
jgi:hypothetical protein